MQKDNIKVSILGSGIMGSQIAMMVALSGYHVILWNHKKKEDLQSSLRKIGIINARLGFILKDEIDPAINRISYSQCLEDLVECNLVIETVSEDYSIKSDLIKKISNYIKNDAIISSNSSTISPTLLAANTCNPSRFIGLHFFNPPLARDLVEIIKAEQTSEQTVIQAKAFCESLKRYVVVMDESPGFIVNRILFPMINEAIFLNSEANIEAKEIDLAMKHGTGNLMGPLELADYIGLDICLNILETLALETGDQKYRPAPVLRRMVRAGKLGKKTKSGFYLYK